MKANVILIGIAVIVFAGLYLLFPYTDMGKAAYEANRSNAILYIQAVCRDPDPEYQKEVQRLIRKYDLQGIYETGSVNDLLRLDFER